MASAFHSPNPAVDDIANLTLRALQGAFEGVDTGVTAADIHAMITQPPQREWGDYALPCFRFAKALKKSPQDAADTLSNWINQSGQTDWVQSTSTLKGFLNFVIRKEKLASYILPKIQSKEFFTKPGFQIPAEKNVMIEYSQPNTHKNFHIGHARNVCLGDSLVRIYKYSGFNVTPVNYIGDEGTHIAECLWYWEKHGLKDPGTEEERVEALEQSYIGAKKAVAEAASEDEKKKILEEIGAVHHQLEAKKGAIYKQFLETKEWSMTNFKHIYEWLDAHFDHYFFESEMTEESQRIVDEYLKKGVFVLDQGAIGLNLEKDNLGFCLLRKSNGATLYATKDLALARQKFEKYKVDRSVYVVAAEQIRHFQQVFKTLEYMGFPQAKNCYHLSYAFVRLPDGKMSTRKGSAVHFGLVRDEMLKELQTYLEKYTDWSPKEKDEVAHKLALGAIKYGMLCTDPNKEIIFQLKDWLSFEGNTGPYLMYAYARAQSILRKAAEAGLKPKLSDYKLLANEEEQALMRYLYDFNQTVLEACEKYYPTTICTHLFYMSKEFNRYYANVSIMKSETPELASMRLALVDSFTKVLAQGLNLLGIPTIEKM